MRARNRIGITSALMPDAETAAADTRQVIACLDRLSEEAIRLAYRVAVNATWRKGIAAAAASGAEHELEYYTDRSPRS